MRLFYEITVITLAPSQWNQIHPWPIRVALAVMALIAAIGHLWLRLKQTFYAIRVVATAGQAAGRVVRDDLAYEAGRILMKERMRRLSYA